MFTHNVASIWNNILSPFILHHDIKSKESNSFMDNEIVDADSIQSLIEKTRFNKNEFDIGIHIANLKEKNKNSAYSAKIIADSLKREIKLLDPSQTLKIGTRTIPTVLVKYFENHAQATQIGYKLRSDLIIWGYTYQRFPFSKISIMPKITIVDSTKVIRIFSANISDPALIIPEKENGLDFPNQRFSRILHGLLENSQLKIEAMSHGSIPFELDSLIEKIINSSVFPSPGTRIYSLDRKMYALETTPVGMGNIEIYNSKDSLLKRIKITPHPMADDFFFMGNDLKGLSWSPGSKWLAAMYHYGEGGHISISSVDSGNEIELIPIKKWYNQIKFSLNGIKVFVLFSKVDSFVIKSMLNNDSKQDTLSVVEY